MKIFTRLLCAGVMACMLGAMLGCDVDIDRGSRGAYYDPYPYSHRYLYQRRVYVPYNTYDRDYDRDHVRFQGRVDVR